MTHTRAPAGCPTYRRDTTLKLNRKIEDLEDVRAMMMVLKEVREKESEIDNLIGPIEDMYTLLSRYEVRWLHLNKPWSWHFAIATLAAPFVYFDICYS